MRLPRWLRWILPRRGLLTETEEMILIAVAYDSWTGLEIWNNVLEMHGKWLALGTLYTTLRVLGHRGFVTFEESKDQDGRLRIYTITRAGAEALEKQLEINRQS